jgi:hypothetical protein
MTDLAELRLHLHDEHVRSGTAKTRLKRNTTSHTQVPTPAPPTSSASPAQSTTPLDQNPSSGSLEPSATETGAPASFTSLAQTLIQQLDDDDDNSTSRSSSTSVLGNSERIKIADLFNFRNWVNWVNHTKRYATQRLNEELEMYDLIEADADDGAQPELGGMAESLLVP